MKEKKVTMSDIAKMSGVAKSTVSRYFNGGYVKDDTRSKIKKVIEENNYQPNAFAQSLKAKESKIIGIIAPTLTSITSSRMLMSADKYLKDQGYTSLIINTNHNQLQELSSIEKLWSMNVDGIILLATNITMAHRNLAVRLDTPIVFLAQKLDEGISIVNDDYHAGFDIGQYAGSLGHKNVVYLSVGNSDVAVGYERKRGVVDGLAAYGINKIVIKETDFSFFKTRKIVNDLLKQQIPSLIICATDTIALATYKELREHGLQVPHDISLIGFGGYETSELLTPSLCTVRFNNEEAGELASKTLIKMIKQEKVDQIHTIGYQFVIGGSVKDIKEK